MSCQQAWLQFRLYVDVSPSFTDFCIIPPVTNIHTVIFSSSLTPKNSISALKVFALFIPAIEYIQFSYTATFCVDWELKKEFHYEKLWHCNSNNVVHGWLDVMQYFKAWHWLLKQTLDEKQQLHCPPIMQHSLYLYPANLTICQMIFSYLCMWENESVPNQKTDQMIYEVDNVPFFMFLPDKYMFHHISDLSSSLPPCFWFKPLQHLTQWDTVQLQILLQLTSLLLKCDLSSLNMASLVLPLDFRHGCNISLCAPICLSRHPSFSSPPEEEQTVSQTR